MTSGSGTASFAPNANTPGATVTVSQYGTKEFTWTEVNGSCSDNDAVTVNFYEQPLPMQDQVVMNVILTLCLNASASVGTGTWTMTSGSGIATFAPNANTPGATVTVSHMALKNLPGQRLMEYATMMMQSPLISMSNLLQMPELEVMSVILTLTLWQAQVLEQVPGQ